MTDLIRRADALAYPIRIDHYDKEHGNRHFVLGIESVMEYIENLPSAELVLQTPQTYGKSINPSNAEVVSDYIRRADAIEAVKHSTAYMHDDLYEAISRIPSAETTGALDDAIAKYVADGYMLPPSGDLIRRADAIARIANDNVVGGMDRINEYRECTEHNDYLDGISDAIATVDDIPSAEGGDADTNPIPTGTGVMIQSPNNGADLSAEAEPKRVLQGYCKGADCKWWNPQIEGCNRCVMIQDEYTHPSAEAEQTDCTEFIRWLTETVMDDGMWEMNAVAYGEVIARKLTKLGVLEVKDDVYVYEPSADATQGWIPCSERLPNEKQEVYVTVYFIEGDTGRAYGYIDGFGKWHLYSTVEGTLNSGYEVTAWMPLPTPYKGGAPE